MSPRLNTDVIYIFLRQCSDALAENEHSVIIGDGAGLHRAAFFVVPANIRLIELSSYSPELNPMENAWRYLKRHCWSNRAYDDYDHLMDAAQHAWRKAGLMPELKNAVCNAPCAKTAEFN